MARSGPRASNVISAANATSIPCGSTSTYYTKAFDLSRGVNFGLSYKATSDGSVDLKIELEQSWVKPATEGSSDSNWLVPGAASDIETNLTVETLKHKTISPFTLQYGRLKITGQGSNHSSTVLEAWLSILEDI